MRRLADSLADLQETLRNVTSERDRLAKDEENLLSQLRELSSTKSAVSETVEAVKQQMQQLEGQLAAHEQYRYQATHDSLTGLWNRAAIFEILERELARAKRENRSVGLVLADVDHFKRVNDTFGHVAGDTVLKEVAGRLSASLRDYDSVGRYGGEEFLMILPGCDAENALKQADRVRACMAARPVTAEEGEIAVTISLGVSAANDPASMGLVLRAADAALYKAKNAGRNRAALADGLVSDDARSPQSGDASSPGAADDSSSTSTG